MPRLTLTVDTNSSARTACHCKQQGLCIHSEGLPIPLFPWYESTHTYMHIHINMSSIYISVPMMHMQIGWSYNDHQHRILYTSEPPPPYLDEENKASLKSQYSSSKLLQSCAFFKGIFQLVHTAHIFKCSK